MNISVQSLKYIYINLRNLRNQINNMKSNYRDLRRQYDDDTVIVHVIIFF